MSEQDINSHVMYERGINDAKESFRSLLKHEMESLLTMLNSSNDGEFLKKNGKFKYLTPDLVKYKYEKQIEQCKRLYNYIS